MGVHHMLRVQEVQAARDVQRNTAAVPPPAQRVCCATAMRIASQRAEQVAALHTSRVRTNIAELDKA